VKYKVKYKVKRNPLNTNQSLLNESKFDGIRIQSDKGLMIVDYLRKAHLCFMKSIEQYRSVFMLRFDLHLPNWYPEHLTEDNSLMDKFMSSLKAKIRHSQETKRRSGIRVHDTNLRYIWCRERSTQGRVHFHVAILLNHDAYAHIGEFSLDKENMFTRLHEAWASALGIYVNNVVGLIHIPLNPTYCIHRDDIASFEDAFYRVSYFCKIDSKDFSSGHHSFGSSRV
jgi:hypothetical protein